VIELRRVETNEDVDVFLALRTAIDPVHVMHRAGYVEEIKRPARSDFIATLDGEPAGCAFVEPHGDNADGPAAWVSVRVLRERRRQGVGTVLFREVSTVARVDGRDTLVLAARHDDADTLDYVGKRGFVEGLRMRESVLDLAESSTRFTAPEGIELVALAAEHEPGMYAAAQEFMRDIPTSEGSIEIGDFDRWRKDHLRTSTAFDCSFVALEDGAVVGYTVVLVDNDDGVGLNGITGVVRAVRRRGVALALKRASIDAARARGLRELRTANAMENPMRLVNERLGYRRDVDWIHLRGPLLDGWEAARVPRSS
jgi:mycothiol synthase